MAQLTMIRGIGEEDLATLRANGIKSMEAFLEAAATKKNRKDLAEKTGIPESNILEWANKADLNRVKGIGKAYSNLLEAAGVDTVPELAKRKPENLFKKLAEVNAEKPVVKWLPTQELVEDWVAQAAALPRILQY